MIIHPVEQSSQCGASGFRSVDPRSNLGRLRRYKLRQARIPVACSSVKVVSSAMSVIDTTLGTTLIGAIISTGMYGVTLGQTLIYWMNNDKDGWAMKAFVLALIFFETLQECFVLDALWYYLVVKCNGDPSGYSRSHRSLILQTVPTQAVAALVQCFFVLRILRFSRRNWIFVISAPIVLAFGCSTAYVVQALRHPTFASWHIGRSSAILKILDLTAASPRHRVVHVQIIDQYNNMIYRRFRTDYKSLDSSIHLPLRRRLQSNEFCISLVVFYRLESVF
ncbi:hypothetical protein OE88DRAFT_373119 [Heliocybe sulcata]|uniref:Uncharacterized protein n=1 Tax=Heliocybe sulcata TaxID=5364 RepID=A0A5C3N7G0_9AGAM|nr:hypothetical protein OE88DRAFT_373119 [Heliocybe sulcata]